MCSRSRENAEPYGGDLVGFQHPTPTPSPGPEEGGKGPNDPSDPLGHAEAIPKGKLFRTSPNATGVPKGPFRGLLRRENAEPNVSGFVWLDLGGFEQLS